MAKRLPPPEPITFEELSATQVGGFDEFLRFRPGETSLPPSHVTSTQEETGTVPFINTVPLSTTVPDSKPRVRVFRATRVEHAHTAGERIIYEALWRSAQGDQVSRTIQIGYDRLASLASVNWKTARSCLKSLENKLAVETIRKENSNTRVGKTYRIYSFTAILERRKAAGLEWVEKGRGARFVKTGTVPDIATVPLIGTVPETGTVTVPETGTVTVPVSGTPLGSLLGIKKETSSSEVLLVSKHLTDLVPIDDDAVRQVIENCRHQDPTATTDEIVHFAGIMIRQNLHNTAVTKLNGLLIRTLPKYFAPGSTALAKLRAGKGTATRREVEAAQLAETRRAKEAEDQALQQQVDAAWAGLSDIDRTERLARVRVQAKQQGPYMTAPQLDAFTEQLAKRAFRDEFLAGLAQGKEVA